MNLIKTFHTLPLIHAHFYPTRSTLPASTTLFETISSVPAQYRIANRNLHFRSAPLLPSGFRYYPLPSPIRTFPANYYVILTIPADFLSFPLFISPIYHYLPPYPLPRLSISSVPLTLGHSSRYGLLLLPSSTAACSSITTINVCRHPLLDHCAFLYLRSVTSLSISAHSLVYALSLCHFTFDFCPFTVCSNFNFTFNCRRLPAIRIVASLSISPGYPLFELSLLFSITVCFRCLFCCPTFGCHPTPA